MDYLETLELAFEWRDIEEYEGLYKVSECGDIMSIKNGEKKLLKPRTTHRGYLEVNLYKNGKRKAYYIHRLVATAFCEGANEFEEVNHVDEDKTNNHYENLEWCSREYNVRYTLNKRVKCTELDIAFDSINDAADYINTNASNISKCLTGITKTAGGYSWEYVD